MTEQKKKPALTLRDGKLKAAIWRNESENGNFYSVTFSRTYKTDEGYADSTSFSGTELLQLARLADKAYEQAAALREQDYRDADQGSSQ